MKGVDFLALARLLANESTEAAWRSSVSRAYYATFHVARELMRDLGFTIPRADKAHTYLEYRLSNCGDPSVQLAGSQLGTLKSSRNRADYDLHLAIGQQVALTSCQTADNIVQILTTAHAKPIRTQVTNAMKLFERTVLKVTTWHP